MSLKTHLASLLRPNNKTAFAVSLPPDGAVFDIGCGNRSAERFKQIQPHMRYVGIDVGDYMQSEASFDSMDRYLRVESPDFASSIANIGETFDAVISSHNIEHCEEPTKVIDAMCSVLKPGGMLYLAFPCAASANFPKRSGTLNFFDDPTHQQVPDFAAIKASLQANGMTIVIEQERSRPFVYAAAGLLLEPWSALTKQVDRQGAIWALWGFETIIWASKTS